MTITNSKALNAEPWCKPTLKQIKQKNMTSKLKSDCRDEKMFQEKNYIATFRINACNGTRLQYAHKSDLIFVNRYVKRQKNMTSK